MTARRLTTLAVVLVALAGCFTTPAETVHGSLVAVQDWPVGKHGQPAHCTLKVAPLNGDTPALFEYQARNVSICDQARGLLGRFVLVHITPTPANNDGWAYYHEVDSVKEAPQ